jgi:sialic acid synthase
MKGTDQSGSLGPDGVYRMVRDIRVAEKWAGVEDIYIEKDVLSAKAKLERSIATKRELKAGEIIKEEDLQLLSPGDGYKWSQKEEIIGKSVKINIPQNELIYPDTFR